MATSTPDTPPDTEKSKMLSGLLYHAFSPQLTAEREACAAACHIFNRDAPLADRVARINLWNAIQQQPPIAADTPAEALDAFPWVEAPFRADYGAHVELGENVYINAGCTVIDTCKVTIGARTLLGPSVNLYAGTHPLDAAVRNGTRGPELGAPITIGEDCWLGGNVTVLAGVTIGARSVVGAGSVVTKDVPADRVVAGNPARVIRRLDGRGASGAGETGARENGAGENGAAENGAMADRVAALEKELQDMRVRLMSFWEQRMRS
ncbi:trimeric LpxA-like protein [Geopyxis carbonaria]|nr:trimeric LpxA-like protein [Geopyxis carbonaria]